MLARLYAGLIDPLLRETREMIPGFAGMVAGDRALDVCCGTGSQANVYAAAGLKAAGIDNSPDMISWAVDGSRRAGSQAVSFALADATSLPFSDASFDFVSVFFALHDKPEPVRSRTLDEMKRVVKPGGTLVLVDYKVPLEQNRWSLLARAVEFAVGGSHYRGFQQFVHSGGLPGLLAGSGIMMTGKILQVGGLVEMVKGTVGSFPASSQPSGCEAN